MTPPGWRWQDHFQVWGCYGQRRLDGEDFAVRSRLELFAHDIEPRAAIDGAPGLVAVMMNPGGSRPLRPPDADGWSPAQPDRTQLQLMRLATAVRPACRHIRVLNLSDLRTPQSAELFGWLARLHDRRHSLFHPERRNECERLLSSPETPVLRAWGMGPALQPWAAPAVAATAGRPVLGLTEDGLRYRHPLPQHAGLQQAWRDAVLRQWQALRTPASGQGLSLIRG